MIVGHTCKGISSHLFFFEKLHMVKESYDDSGTGFIETRPIVKPSKQSFLLLEIAVWVE